MNWKISNCLVVLLLVSCNQSAEKQPEEKTTDQSSTYRTNSLMEAGELSSLLEEQHVKIIDFRKKSAYSDGHISGALNFWRPDIESNMYPYGGMLAEKEVIEDVLGKLGIRNGDLLVVYDDIASCDAARCWWALKYYGYDNLKILNGGFDAWKQLNGTVDQRTPAVENSDFRFNNYASESISIALDELKQARANKGLVLIDTRTDEEFSGLRQKKGAARAGRIPNAMHVDWVENMHYDASKKFKPADELSAIYEMAGASRQTPIVTYCHSGVRSALTFFVLTELLDYTNVRNYDGSWTEWSYYENLPLERDTITSILE